MISAASSMPIVLLGMGIRRRKDGLESVIAVDYECHCVALPSRRDSAGGAAGLGLGQQHPSDVSTREPVAPVVHEVQAMLGAVRRTVRIPLRRVSDPSLTEESVAVHDLI